MTSPEHSSGISPDDEAKLRADMDRLYDEMQEPEARTGVERAFSLTPSQMRELLRDQIYPKQPGDSSEARDQH